MYMSRNTSAERHLALKPGALTAACIERQAWGAPQGFRAFHSDHGDHREGVFPIPQSWSKAAGPPKAGSTKIINNARSCNAAPCCTSRICGLRDGWLNRWVSIGSPFVPCEVERLAPNSGRRAGPRGGDAVPPAVQLTTGPDLLGLAAPRMSVVAITRLRIHRTC